MWNGIRITNGICHSYSLRRTIQIESCTNSSYKERVKSKYVDRWDRGQWARRPRLSIRSRMHIANVSNIHFVCWRKVADNALAIEMSEHFVYIENQFFITSTVVDGVPIVNGVGDALVERIIRAHKEGTPWRACIVIPLLPGYTYPIDSNEASSVRLILECQNRTICRGTNSIFSRLKKEGIDPDDYICLFSLRGWAKFKSGVLTTEQVYIHGKTMIVDDRECNRRVESGPSGEME